MNLTIEQKKQLIEGRLNQISQQQYIQELNLIAYEAYNEREELINATKENIQKQKLAYIALEKELNSLEV